MSISKQVSNYMAEIGRRGGKSKSEKKLKALKKNSKKGGWQLYWRAKRAAKRNGDKHE